MAEYSNFSVTNITDNSAEVSITMQNTSGFTVYNMVWLGVSSASVDDRTRVWNQRTGNNNTGTISVYLSNLSPSTKYDLVFTAIEDGLEENVEVYSDVVNYIETAQQESFTTLAPAKDAVFVDSNLGSTLRVGSYYSLLRVSARYSNNINASGYPDSLTSSEFTSGEYHYFTLKGTIKSSDLSGSSTVYTVSMTAFAADGVGNSDTATDTLTVKDGLPEISGSLSNDMRVGENYEDSLSKNTYARTISSSGTITSNGLSFNSDTLTLEGNPNNAGNYSFSVSGTNSSNESDSYSITFNVLPLLPTWEDDTISTTFILDEDYNDSISANNATAYEVTSGSLPSGISLDSITGEINGIPDTAGEQSLFTLGAKNSADEYIYTQQYNVTVQENGGNLLTYNGSSWQENEVYAYLDGSWTRARVYVYDGNDWIKSAQL